ncbi:iron ABC transporter permease [Egicoccus sp. AB-alg2]|uniref:iron ABC transporter permease n=1 Tax=Egicoccus sp. AB-alg2 TaxID=3242693 RepID=UPI00359E874D
MTRPLAPGRAGTDAPDTTASVSAPVRPVRVAAVGALAVGAVVVVAVVHVTQGTSSVGAGDLLRLLVGQGADRTAAVFVASRLPRLLAGALVGVALGCSGAALQSLARNPLASPDTLGVNAGAYLAVVAAAAFGWSLPVLPAGGLAFVGGLLAAGLVLALSAGGVSGPTRLILAGSAVALALHSLTVLLLLLFGEATVGLFAWGSGSLVQSNLRAVSQMAPVVAVGVAGAMALAHRLDLLALGDDTAAVLGVPVRTTRLLVVLVAVLLSAAAVTVAGPVGFVGLVAPVLVRLFATRLPDLHRHRVLFPLAGLTGILVVLGADVLLRAVLGGQGGIDVPTGVVTTGFGALVLIWLAARFRDSGPTRQPAAAGVGARTRRRFVTVTVLATAVVLGAAVLGMLAGDLWVLGGDLVNWASGRSGRVVTLVLDARFPRVVAALAAGAALAVAGTVVQAVCRNPLAEPGLLGITGGAGLAAVVVLLVVPSAGIWGVTGAAATGAVAAFALVYGLAARGGLVSDRLVLIGIGVWQGAGAVITFVILVTSPWNVALALTWLSGSTYGRTLAQVAPVALALAVLTPVAAFVHRELDLVRLDDDTPRVLGVALARVRLTALLTAALLTAAAVSAIGVVGFVGLVAPHLARALVGAHHRRLLPVAALLGAALVSIADTLGRSVIAPAQVPAGLLTALIGTPYFVWLLWRSRTAA